MLRFISACRHEDHRSRLSNSSWAVASR